MFCYKVNRHDGPDTIKVKYFEKGRAHLWLLVLSSAFPIFLIFSQLLLADVRSVRFSKGSLKMFWMTSPAQDYFGSVSFLKKMIKKKKKIEVYFETQELTLKEYHFQKEQNISITCNTDQSIQEFILAKFICEWWSLWSDSLFWMN